MSLPLKDHWRTAFTENGSDVVLDTDEQVVDGGHPGGDIDTLMRDAITGAGKLRVVVAMP
jgi:hypothetical protein